LKQKGFLERADIVSIDDRFGPTVGGDPLSDEIEGVVVSEETEPGAEEINRIRVKEGKRPLLIVVVSMVLADDGKPISSTRIRRQEVDRYGRLIG
jgi:phosphopantetheine adenylyltransferase